ncbi:MAG: hypothetical protein Q9220_006935 [cf. Caloplaca sp. 1 TL-2023]
MTKSTPASKFPAHSEPRVWLLTAGKSPIGLALSRQLLAHGDSVVFGTTPSDVHGQGNDRNSGFSTFWKEEVLVQEGWKSRARIIGLDGRCEVAMNHSRYYDSLLMLGIPQESVVGAVEELGASGRTSALVREQFETNYFGYVNIIKAALPLMRARNNGHIILITGIMAPFNIKMTIVQPNLEIGVLTNKITAAPQLPSYRPEANPAPLFREIIGSLLSRLDVTTDGASDHSSGPESLSSDNITTVYPNMNKETTAQLLAETVNALTAIGGHDNPPARHIVGHEAVASVKEKLKTVSEELEDFVEASYAVDVDEDARSPLQTSPDEV